MRCRKNIISEVGKGKSRFELAALYPSTPENSYLDHTGEYDDLKNSLDGVSVEVNPEERPLS